LASHAGQQTRPAIGVCFELAACPLPGNRDMIGASKLGSIREASMNFRSVSLASIAVATLAVPAYAHHSFAMFERDEKRNAAGHGQGIRVDQSAFVAARHGQ
jgi:hypothetical protein